ncbi:hypothetical protein HOLleu_26634 [Holothuria leucospilota]|uniref:Uncharacterized protein n=1 Tax=Holothuria leucospilota TaxID=206669 RepID=A0A9Q1H1Q3_HOLLE|nr:hypothetical protein HOLleu_26634 [Holothuria leucospilota]
MAWRQETSDSWRNWGPSGNPYNPQETGESGGGPGFLELPTYRMSQNVLRFRVRGRKPLKIVIYRDGCYIRTIWQYQGDTNLCQINDVPGQYRVRLIDPQGRSKSEHATITY